MKCHESTWTMLINSKIYICTCNIYGIWIASEFMILEVNRTRDEIAQARTHTQRHMNNAWSEMVILTPCLALYYSFSTWFSQTIWENSSSTTDQACRIITASLFLVLHFHNYEQYNVPPLTHKDLSNKNIYKFGQHLIRFLFLNWVIWWNVCYSIPNIGRLMWFWWEDLMCIDLKVGQFKLPKICAQIRHKVVRLNLSTLQAH